MPARKFDTTAYRYPSEELILGITVFCMLAVIALTATATVCLSVVFIGLFIFFAYSSGVSHHQELIQHAQAVTPANAPRLAELIRASSARLQVEPVDVFVVHSSERNAYTFGLSAPKAVVIYDSLLKIMDTDELQFVIGHELGHVKLGHTWLNSIAGGMAGIPASISAALILTLSLRWWNRACEYSADRAGLLGCSSPQKAITALVKLELGARQLTPDTYQRVMAQIEAEDDSLLSNMEELLATHPMIVRRINQLKNYIKSPAYQRLQSSLNQNLQ